MASTRKPAHDPRPRSPHVLVYRPQLTSVLSFGHRLAGLGLSLGSVALAVWLIAAASGAQAYARVMDPVGSPVGTALMFVWTYALFFHLCNGIRHLFWDGVQGFELRTIYASGWAVVAASVVLTLLAWGWALV